MKYNVGDRVRIKSIDWYNKNKNSNGDVVVLNKVPHFSWCENVRTVFTKDMAKFCGKVVTIEIVWTVNYSIVEGTHRDYFTDEMIEGLVEDENKPIYEDEVEDVFYSTPARMVCPSGYEFRDENGNTINAKMIVLNKKKNKYPKTYEECCKILGCKANHFFTDFSYNGCDVEISDYENKIDDLLQTFRKLRYCRDAYWKIAGDEMGLGKPWEPDYDSGVDKYGIICMNGVIQESNPTTNWERHLNKILDFPTKEMRDTFKENFDPDIEICKEFL